MMNEDRDVCSYQYTIASKLGMWLYNNRLLSISPKVYHRFTPDEWLIILTNNDNDATFHIAFQGGDAQSDAYADFIIDHMNQHVQSIRSALKTL